MFPSHSNVLSLFDNDSLAIIYSHRATKELEAVYIESVFYFYSPSGHMAGPRRWD